MKYSCCGLPTKKGFAWESCGMAVLGPRTALPPCWSLRPELTGPGPLEALGVLQEETSSFLTQGLFVGQALSGVPELRKAPTLAGQWRLSQKPVR